MYKKSAHIVSKFQWNTVFDSREQAFVLQERLSDWCRVNLQKEVEKVFNRLCPADQTWKIDRLEINLGALQFEHLETELLEKIGRYLEMRLRELVLYSNSSNGNIEITDDVISFNDMIVSFLLNGILPWNISAEIPSVNQLLQEQLSHDSRSLIDMLAELGKNNYLVRKRMAWQFSELNLTKILKGLEPANAEEIITFRDELLQIQQEERVVPSGMADLRKHLWEWILNYVYVERGSVFNERSFMKSSIRQMANHYNLSYSELMEMINVAVVKTVRRRMIAGEFIVVFNDIFKEQNEGYDSTLAEPAIDYWQMLANWLNDEGNIKPVIKPDVLILQLSGGDKKRFSKLIQSLNLSLSAWTQIAGSLSNTTLETIVFARQPDRALFIINAIGFLTTLCDRQQIKMNQPLLWATAIRNLKQNRDAATGNRLFIMDAILCLGKTNMVSWEKMLVQLVAAPIPQVCKTNGALEVMIALNDVFLIEISNRPPSFFNNRFSEQLGIYYAMHQDPGVNRKSLATIAETLRKYIRLYPSGAMEMFVRNSDKVPIHWLFEKLIDQYTAGMLLEQLMSGSFHRLLQKLIRKLQQSTANPLSIAHIENQLVRTGLEVGMISPGLSPQKFADLVVSHLFKQLPRSLRIEFTDIVLSKSQSNQEQELEVFYDVVTNRSGTRDVLFDHLTMGDIRSLIIQKKISKQEVREWAHQQIRRLGIRFFSGKDAQLIAEYLQNGAGKVMNREIGEFLGRLLACQSHDSKEGLYESLSELFWKCLLSDEGLSGSVDQLLQLYRSVVRSNFQGIKQARSFLRIPTQTKLILSISIRNIRELIKYCLENCKDTVRYQNSIISVQELIAIMVDKHIDQLGAIIYGLSCTEQQVEFISSVFSFTDLRACLMYKHSQHMSDALADMECIMALSQATEEVVVAASTERQLIKHALMLGKGGKWGKEESTYFLKRKDLPVQEFISIFNEGGVSPGLGVRAVLVDRMPGLVNFLSISDSNQKVALDAIYQKGLMLSLIQFLITYGHAPSWYKEQSHTEKVDGLLSAIINQYPVSLRTVLRRLNPSDAQIRFLEMSVQVPRLLQTIGRAHINQRTLLTSIEELYKVLGSVSIKGISGKDLQSLLFKRVLSAWLSGDWEPVSINQLWNSLAWDICQKTSIDKNEFVAALSFYQSMFPVALIVSLERYKHSDTTQAIEKQSMMRFASLEKSAAYFTETIAGAGIAIKNAGIVLLNSYIPLLFERLGITRDGKFVSLEKQYDAVHCLQFLITGSDSTEEHLLPLNKILCGLEVSLPIADSVMLNKEEIEMMEGLLYSVIAHWPDSGSQTPDGLRGNWLVRNGIVRKEENGWELVVEHKPYDLLLQHSPFSFSVIKFPWMQEPLTVKWKY